MGQWVVQEGGWGYEEHSPKIWCGAGEWEVSRTEWSEGQSKHEMDGHKKNSKSGKNRG